MLKRAMAAIFSVTALLLSAETPSFGEVKVKLSFEHAPTYRTRTGGVLNGGGLFENEQYLVIEAVFSPGVVKEPAAKSRSGKIKRSTPIAKSRAWLDNVKMNVLVAYPEVTGRIRKETIYGVFSGSTLFWSIPLDGKKHTATMFVPPHLLARYTNIRSRSPRKNDGRSPRPAYRLSPRDFFVEVIFTSANGQELGRGYSSVDGARSETEKDNYFRRLENQVGSRKVEGAVFSRNRSPWALINPERYDLIAPTGRVLPQMK